MLASFKTTVLSLLRNKSMLLWALLFPIVLTCIFMGMFSGIESAYSAVGSDLGIVRSASYGSNEGLQQTLRSISLSTGKNGIVKLSYFDSEAAARKAIADEKIDSYLTVSNAGSISLHVGQRSLGANGSLPTTILASALNSHLHATNAVAVIMARVTPGGSVPASLASGDGVSIKRLVLTKNAPDPDVRYYFSLLAMTSGIGSAAAMLSIQRLQPTEGAVGARQSVSSTPRWCMLVGALLGSWLCQFACMLAALLFMALVARVNFGTGAAPLLLAIAASSLTGCAAGALLGTIPHMEDGMVSGITCLLSLFTGLYGPASQLITDSLEATAPTLIHANPLWQMTNCFYSLLYYDLYGPFLSSIAALLAMTGIFLAIAAFRMRRISHGQL
jgi:ABC-2 type transport system permease protein